MHAHSMQQGFWGGRGRKVGQEDGASSRNNWVKASGSSDPDSSHSVPSATSATYKRVIKASPAPGGKLGSLFGGWWEVMFQRIAATFGKHSVSWWRLAVDSSKND